MTTGAVIAAAGMSSRMGACKQLLRIGGLTLVERILRSFQAVGVEELVVVTGFRADEVEASLAGYPVTFLRNERYRQSQMFDSAKLGFAHLQGRCRRVFFTPADVPLFSTATLRALLAVNAPLVQPVTDSQLGHPILLGREVLPLLLADEGEGGLAGALARTGVAAQLLPVADPGSLLDADTPEAFARLNELYHSPHQTGGSC